MKYLDTNIIIRIITGDNPELATRAITEIQQSGQNTFGILDAILVETCFVLEFHQYKMARADIASALQALVSTPQIFATAITCQAISVYGQHSELDYADCLLFVTDGKKGVFTFDRQLQNLLLK